MSDPTARARLSIPTRILVGFAVVLAVFGGVSALSLARHQATTQALRLIHDEYLPLFLHVGEAHATQKPVRELFLERVLERSWDARGALRFARQVRARSLREALVRVAHLRSLDLAPEDRALVQDLEARLREVRALYDASERDYVELFRALDAGALARAEAARDALRAREAEAQDSLRWIRRALEGRMRSLASEAGEREREAVLVLGLLTATALAVGLLVTWWSRRLLLPLPRLQARVAAVARGDLAGRLAPARDDELGRLTAEFERMVDALSARDRRLREAAEAQARLQRMREQILADLRAGVLVVDGEEALRIVNPSAERILGLPRGAVGAPLAASSLPRRAPRLVEAVSRVRRGEERAVLEGLELGDGGTRVDVLATPFEPLERDGTATARSVLVVVDDVTEELRTKARLIHTERLAAIGRMAAHVTHEVRNPLSSIALNVELLEEELVDAGDEARALLRAIHAEIDRLTAVTEEYLRLARLPEPRLEPDDVGDLVREVTGFVAPEMRAAGVELLVELAPELPAVALDDAQLRQALLNLLRNAREAMPEGGVVRVAVAAEEGGDGREGVALRVEDRGAGIDPADRSRIFELFFTTKEQGSGLGLPLTQQIVLAHGGRIRCGARAGGGTVFDVWLPASGASVAPRAAAEGDARPPQATMAPG